MSYMKGLLPDEAGGQLFRYIWMNALPETIHKAYAADKEDLDTIAVKATKFMREKAARRTRTAHVYAVEVPNGGGPDSCDVDAMTAGRSSKGKKGYVRANHLR